MRKLFALLFICSFFSSPAFAARGFGSTFGTGSTDLVVTGYATALTQSHTFATWFWVNGTGGGTFGRVYDVGTNSQFIEVNASTTAMSSGELFTTTEGQWNWTVAASAWHHLCYTYSGSATGNIPVVYIDGASVSVTVNTAPVGTWTNGGAVPIDIGNRSDSIRGWDGKLADFGYWNVILTAGECLSLAQGASPFNVRQGSLQAYIPLDGFQTGEPDWGATHASQTVTGALFVGGPLAARTPLFGDIF